MEKAAKLLTTALALWLSVASCANSAGLYEEQTRPTRTKHAAAKTRPSFQPCKQKRRQTQC